MGLTDPHMGALIAAASGLLAGAGAGLVVLIMVGLFSIQQGLPHKDELVPAVLIPFLGLAVEGFLAIALLRVRGRRWFREQSHATRVATVAIGWILTAIGILIEFFVMQ